MEFEKLYNSKIYNNMSVGDTETNMINNLIKDDKTGIEIKKSGETYEVWRHGAKLKEYKQFDKMLEYLVRIVKGEENPPEEQSFDPIPDDFADDSADNKPSKVTEAIDMLNQDFSHTTWSSARRVWNKLVSAKIVYPTDHEGFISFQSFFEKFLEKNDREPTLKDIENLWAKSLMPQLRR